jgi:hypothetical protein
MELTLVHLRVISLEFYRGLVLGRVQYNLMGCVKGSVNG